MLACWFGPVLQLSKILKMEAQDEITKAVSLLFVQIGSAQAVTTPETQGTIVNAFG